MRGGRIAGPRAARHALRLVAGLTLAFAGCRGPAVTLISVTPAPSLQTTPVPLVLDLTPTAEPSPSATPTASPSPSPSSTPRTRASPTPRVTPTPAPTPRALALRRGDSGTKVTLGVGDTLTVTLDECSPSCGHRWHYESPRPDPEIIEETSDRREPGATPAAVGGQVRRTWTFKAVGRGTTDIRLVYVPPSDGAPQDRWSATVVVG